MVKTVNYLEDLIKWYIPALSKSFYLEMQFHSTLGLIEESFPHLLPVHSFSNPISEEKKYTIVDIQK